MKKLLLAGAMLLAATAAHAQAFGGGLGSTNSSDWNERSIQSYRITPNDHTARPWRHHRHGGSHHRRHRHAHRRY